MSGVYYEGIDLQSRTRSITRMDLPWVPADLEGDVRIQRELAVDLEVGVYVHALARGKAARAEALLAAREARAWAKGDGR